MTRIVFTTGSKTEHVILGDGEETARFCLTMKEVYGDAFVELARGRYVEHYHEIQIEPMRDGRN